MHSLVWRMAQQNPCGRRNLYGDRPTGNWDRRAQYSAEWDRQLLLILLQGGGHSGLVLKTKEIQALADLARKQFCDCGGMAALLHVLENPDDKVGNNFSIV